MRLRLVVSGVTLLGLLAVFVTPALAHALLVRSVPEANAQLDRPPAQVELFFSEALDPAFSTAAVLDSSGARVDNGDAKVDPTDSTHLTVSLQSLPDGVYTVSWKALSAADGHVTTGAFPFAVGKANTAALAAAAQGSPQAPLSLGQVLAKWLLYLSAAAVTGGILFVSAVWRPAQAGIRGGAGSAASFEPPWPDLARASLIVLIIAQALGLLVEAGQASGTGLAAPWSRSVETVLYQTRFGVVWLSRLFLVFLLARFLPRAVSSGASGTGGGLIEWSALCASVLLLLTVSLGSHASADAEPVIPVLMDWIHLTAASVWVGGLIYFVAGMRAVRGLGATYRTRLTARLIPRFSIPALLSVNALAITGLNSIVLRVGTVDALVNSPYGRTLIVKLALASLMVSLGAINLLFVTPRMERAALSAAGSPSLVNRFLRMVTVEVTLGAALLLSVGVLASLPPARVAPVALSLARSTEADDLHLVLTVTPGRVGINTFTVKVTSGRQAVDGAKEVELRFTPSSGKVAPSQLQLSGQGNGEYSAKGGYLSLPDTWQAQVAVRREGKFDSYADFELDIGSTAPAMTAAGWTRMAAVLLLASALSYAFVFLARGRIQPRQVTLGYVPAVALLVVGAAVLFSPPVASSAGQVNPIPPNAASIAKGEAIYAARCVACHGESGKGDGPVGLTLNPRPADLTVHAVPGVHTDAQLYEWITNGFPGSVMPHFAKVLSDEDRWNLVNFIRTFAPRSSP